MLESICVSLNVTMFFKYHAGCLTVRSSKMTVNCKFEQSDLLSKSSKPDRSNPDSLVFWIGDLNSTARHPSCIASFLYAQTDIKLKFWCLQRVLLKAFCNKYKTRLCWYYLDDHFELSYSLISRTVSLIHKKIIYILIELHDFSAPILQ